MEEKDAPWRVSGISNLGSRLYCPLVSLTNGRVFRTVRLEIDAEELKGMSLREIEVIAIGLANLNRGRSTLGS
ncbi:hypothetical protein [Enterobacter sp. Bisph1]|uniref:hypothetical protein n=1 Tax=Enterobacter sp. Bisph1 TaxID=1274399 RepID=UPI00057BD168|nr:hypothetical protein [Enterobacter sp. Bisph1]